MSRRLLLPLVLAVAVLLSAGCADDVSPAARVGDTTISVRDFEDELAEWKQSDTLIAKLQLPAPEGEAPGSYSTSYAGFVLTNRVSFELHNQEFAALDLELTDQELADVRAGLIESPETSAIILDELSAEFGDRLVADVARQFKVSQTLGADYEAWQAEAFGADQVEVNPRYGTWSAAATAVSPPVGPLAGPAGS